MSIFKFFKKSNVGEFASYLVKKVEKKYPVSLDTGKQRKISERKLTKILESVYSEAQKYKEEHNLKVYGKAKLVNEFKWGLKDLGYSEKFIDVVSEGLTVYLSK